MSNVSRCARAVNVHDTAREATAYTPPAFPPYPDLYKILPLPLLYCVWHTKGKSGRRRILRKMCATVLQSRVSDAGGRGNTRMID